MSTEDQLPVRYVSDEERHEQQRQAEEAAVNDDLELLSRMERAYELHLAGVGYRKIAEQLGVPTMTCYRMVQKYIRMHAPIVDPGTYAAEQMAELALCRKKVVAEALLVPREERPFHATALVLLKLQERQDRLTRREQRTTIDEFEAMTDDQLAAHAAGH